MNLPDDDVFVFFGIVLWFVVAAAAVLGWFDISNELLLLWACFVMLLFLAYMTAVCKSRPPPGIEAKNLKKIHF